MRCFVSLVLSLEVALTACGGSDADCVIDTDCPLYERCEANACVPVGAGGDAGRDGGAQDGGARDGGADGGTAPRGVGSVTINQIPLGVMGELSTHSMAAYFSEAASSACSETTMGACQITDCPIAMPPADAGVPVDAGMPTAPRAGTITLAGGTVPLSITPESSGIYAPASGMGLLFAGGAALTVTAEGGDVPGFMQMVTAPGAVTVSAPSFAAAITVDRSVDFNLAWAAAMATTPGRVRARLSGSDATHTVSVACTFDATAASGSIPSAALASLPSGTGSITIDVRAGTTMPVGTYSVSVEVSTMATADTGSPASGATTIP